MGAELGAAFKRIGDRFLAADELRRESAIHAQNLELAQLREQQLGMNLAISQLELMGSLAYSPQEQALLKKQMDVLDAEHKQAIAEKDALQLQIDELNLDLVRRTQDSKVIKAENEATQAQLGTEKDRVELQQAVLNKQQDQMDAIFPSDDEMEEISRAFPTLASSLEAVRQLASTQVYIGRDEEGVPLEERFNQLLSTTSQMLQFELDPEMAAAFGIPENEMVDVVTFARMRTGQQDNVNQATDVFRRLDSMKRDDIENGLLNEDGTPIEGKVSPYMDLVNEVYGGLGGLRIHEAAAIGDSAMAFASPQTMSKIVEFREQAQADAAAAEAMSRVNGFKPNPIWDDLRDVGDLSLAEAREFLIKDTSEAGRSKQTSIIHQNRAERELDAIQSSAPDVPGLRYSKDMMSLIKPDERFFLDDFSGDTGVEELFDPSRNQIVNVVTQGYKYNIDPTNRKKLEGMLGPVRWAQIQALPDDRRRATEAHLAVSLPGGPRLGGLNGMGITPGSVQGPKFLRGMYRETLDEVTLTDAAATIAGSLLAGPAVKAGGRVLGGLFGLGSKVAGKVGGKAASKAASEAIAQPPPIPAAAAAAADDAVAGGRTGFEAFKGGSNAEAAFGNLFGKRPPLALPGAPNFQLGAGSVVDDVAQRAAFQNAARRTAASRMPVVQQSQTPSLQGLINAARSTAPSPAPAVPLQQGFRPAGLLPDQSRAFQLVDYTGPAAKGNVDDRLLAIQKLLNRVENPRPRAKKVRAKSRKK